MTTETIDVVAAADVASASVNDDVIENASEIAKNVSLGSHTVSLFDLHTDIYKNPRDKATFDEIEKLRLSMENKGQLIRVSCSVAEKGGEAVLGVYGGFTRTEALKRTALRPVITEWNEAHGYSEGSPGYISPLSAKMGYEAAAIRQQIRDAGGEWKEKFDTALKNAPIRIDVMPSVDDKETFMRAFIENFCRSDMSVWNTCQSMEVMRRECGYSGKDLADAVGVSQANISQFNTIFSLPEQFRAMVAERTEPEKLTESDIALTETLIDAFVQGVSVPAKEPGSIQFSCARYIATAIRNRGKNYLKIKDACSLLCLLTKLNRDGKHDPTVSDVDQTVFKKKVEAACEKPIVLKEFNPEEQLNEAINSVNVEDLIAAQQSQSHANDIVINEPDLDDVVDSTIDSLLSESGSGLEPTSAVDSAIASTLATLVDTNDDDDEVIEGDDGSGDDGAIEDIEDEEDDLDALADSLLEGIEDAKESLAEAAGEEDEEDEGETGEKRTKTVSDVQQKLETKPAQKILNKIHQCVLLIHTEIEQGQSDMDWIDIIASIAECAAMADCVGSTKLSAKFEDTKISVASGLSDLFKKLIDHAKKTMPGEKYQQTMALLPKITKEDFPIM